MSIRLMSDVWELPLNTNEKMVLLAIADHANDDGVAYPSWERIQKKCSISSKSTITKIMKILEGVGIIEVTKRGDLKEGRKTNIYKVYLSKSTHLELIDKLAIEREKHKRTISTHLEPSKSTHLEPKMVHTSNSNHQGTISSSLNHQNNCIEIIADERTSKLSTFELFWERYPLKKDKGGARMAFYKAMKKVTFQIMIGALEIQKGDADWKKENGKYIPFPTTWLDGERWLDEIKQEVDKYAMLEAVRKATEDGLL